MGSKWPVTLDRVAGHLLFLGMAKDREDWNAMPNWLREKIVKWTYVGAYVERLYPQIYDEAMEARNG
jgi:hypothetical protein